jgi:F-type H+-transporting ATPase subunit b
MLDINPMLLGITVIVFLTLIAVLNSWLYNPLFAFMDKRDADIKKDLAEVGNNDSEIAALNAEAEKMTMDARLEAAALREKVIADAKVVADGKIEAKRSELAKEYAEFEKDMALEGEQLKNALLSQMPLFKEAVKAKFSQI